MKLGALWPRSMTKGPARRAGAAGLCKLCDLHDFARPAIRDTIRAVFPHEVGRFGADYPIGVEYRKHWEVAMAVRALEAGGALHDRAEVLGVGAGNEPTIFYLTTRTRRVFATDLYLQGDWACSSNASMLTDPGRHWPGRWEPRRLVVQHMNALALNYDHDTFDGIFSSSSVEHFGGHDDVRRSLGEMYRVLKPGGVLSVATEFRLAGPGPGMPGTLLFDEAELRAAVLGGLPWELLGPLDLTLSPETWRTVQPFGAACDDVRRHVAEHGQLAFHRLDWSRYPHIVLREGDLVWTSVHLALRKPA